ncbi:MAG: Leu-rich repeat protein [Candidatus Paraimprobicoccus trichonymphae]|uniref:Leu-rich repeat protein n=1 Tax=Candidatus Paraimprobicoccus trichonymphae TaxID=3033793 RepID=A0AA48I2E6_9FIRM|nr:MAG: Leu-rich repeat protein [Candidatus Paraimprobicoccus trichonymphae]
MLVKEDCFFKNLEEAIKSKEIAQINEFDVSVSKKFKETRIAYIFSAEIIDEIAGLFKKNNFDDPEAKYKVAIIIITETRKVNFFEYDRAVADAYTKDDDKNYRTFKQICEQDFKSLLEGGAGVCRNYAGFVYILFSKFGFNNDSNVIIHRGPCSGSVEGHAFNVIVVNKIVYLIDLTQFGQIGIMTLNDYINALPKNLINEELAHAFKAIIPGENKILDFFDEFVPKHIKDFKNPFVANNYYTINNNKKIIMLYKRFTVQHGFSELRMGEYFEMIIGIDLCKYKIVTTDIFDTLEGYDFDNSHHLTYVDFSKSTKLKKIPTFCFKDCWNLNTVVFPDSVEEIEHGAFQDVLNSKNLNISMTGKPVFLSKNNYKNMEEFFEQQVKLIITNPGAGIFGGQFEIIKIAGSPMYVSPLYQKLFDNISILEDGTLLIDDHIYMLTELELKILAQSGFLNSKKMKLVGEHIITNFSFKNFNIKLECVDISGAELDDFANKNFFLSLNSKELIVSEKKLLYFKPNSCPHV